VRRASLFVVGAGLAGLLIGSGGYTLLRHHSSAPASGSRTRTLRLTVHAVHVSPAQAAILKGGPPRGLGAQRAWLRRARRIAAQPIPKNVAVIGRVIHATSSTITLRQETVSVTIARPALPTVQRRAVRRPVVRIALSSKTVLRIHGTPAALRTGTTIAAGGVMQGAELAARFVTDFSSVTTATGRPLTEGSSTAVEARSRRNDGPPAGQRRGAYTLVADSSALPHPTENLPSNGQIDAPSSGIVLRNTFGWPGINLQPHFALNDGGCPSFSANAGFILGLGESENWPFQFQASHGQTIAVTSDSVQGPAVVGHLNPQSDYTYFLQSGGAVTATAALSCTIFGQTLSWEFGAPLPTFVFQNESTAAAPLVGEHISIPSITCDGLDFKFPVPKVPVLKDWTHVGLLFCLNIDLDGAPLSATELAADDQTITGQTPPNPAAPASLLFQHVGQIGPTSSPFIALTTDAPADIAGADGGATFLTNFSYAPHESRHLQFGVTIGADVGKVIDKLKHSGGAKNGSDNPFFGTAKLQLSATVPLPTPPGNFAYQSNERLPFYLGQAPSIHVFHAFASRGRLWPGPEVNGATLHQVGETSGSCIGSIADQANDIAWRCFSDNTGTIYDPCFGDPTGYVDWLYCPIDLHGSVERFDPTSQPTNPNTAQIVDERHCCPWLMTLSNGQTCNALTGTVPTASDGARLPWACGNGVTGEPAWVDTSNWPWVMHLYQNQPSGTPTPTHAPVIVVKGWD